MNSINDLGEVGSKISISRPEKEETHPSQILDIYSEDELLISGPIEKGNLVLIHRNEIIRLEFIVEDVGIYYFDAKVLERKRDGVYSLRVKKTSKIKKIQKREFFRIMTNIPALKEFGKIRDAMEPSGYKYLHSEKCEIRDISGGGVKIYCNYKHNKGDEITCSFEINDIRIETLGIVRRQEAIDTFDYKYSIGVAFKDMKQIDREEIVRYIFDKQRILRHKGLI